MTMNTTIRQDYKQTLDEIATVLPPNRLEQLVDFARFLEAQLLSESLLQEESMAEIEADNEKWDALLETDEGQTLWKNWPMKHWPNIKPTRQGQWLSIMKGVLCPDEINHHRSILEALSCLTSRRATPGRSSLQNAHDGMLYYHHGHFQLWLENPTDLLTAVSPPADTT